MERKQHNYMVKLFKILSNSNRLRILYLLLKSPFGMTVNDISSTLDIEQGNLSNHLIKMRDNGVLRAKQKGKNMYYSLKDQNIERIFQVTMK